LEEERFDFGGEEGLAHVVEEGLEIVFEEIHDEVDSVEWGEGGAGIEPPIGWTVNPVYLVLFRAERGAQSGDEEGKDSVQRYIGGCWGAHSSILLPITTSRR
jgi:hypothetical protein